MEKIAIITARGGSKRIPRKNIKLFAGYPIIKYSIEAAIDSGCFDEVMVSTDDKEIAEIAVQYGAKVPFYRSEATSNDFATTADVLIEVIEKYRKSGIFFDTVCCIYPTAPFVTAEKFRNAVTMFEEKKADSLIPIVRFSFPVLRSFKLENEKIAFNWPEYARTRSQDLAPAFHDAGQFYIVNTNALLKERSLITGNTVGFEIPESECQDIDNEMDWQIATLKFELLSKNEIH
ncbi:MAG TPA: pseudaminic acid cytidylyltransferase [Flavipsychrobacter sp.]|nr:pseudaminic acid cytidylyltransferase [Flavipsychrobacter sp.]